MKDLGLLMLAQVILGSGGTLVRIATSGLDSFVVGCVRFGVVALVLSILRPTRFPLHVEKRLFLVGLCFVQQYICWYAAIARLPLGVASLLCGTSPIFCVLFETFLQKSPPPRSFIWIALSTLVGVGLLYQNPFTDGSRLDGIGIAYGVCAGMGIASTMLAMRSLRVSEYGALDLMGRSNCYTALILGCIGFVHATSWPPFPSSWQPYLAAVALAVLCQGIGCCLQLVALRGVKASIVGISTLMGPLFASVYGDIFFGEVMTLRMVLGGAFILGATVSALRVMALKPPHSESNAQAEKRTTGSPRK